MSHAGANGGAQIESVQSLTRAPMGEPSWRRPATAGSSAALWNAALGAGEEADANNVPVSPSENGRGMSWARLGAGLGDSPPTYRCLTPDAATGRAAGRGAGATDIIANSSVLRISNSLC